MAHSSRPSEAPASIYGAISNTSSSNYLNQVNNLNNQTDVRDSDFILSYTEGEPTGIGPLTTFLTGPRNDETNENDDTIVASQDINKGDALYSDCKDVFMDL